MITLILAFTVVMVLIALLYAIMARRASSKLRWELDSLKRQFNEQVGKLLHETSDERQERELRETAIRNQATEAKKTVTNSGKSESPAYYDHDSSSDEDWCYEKGASPGGGCVGK